MRPEDVGIVGFRGDADKQPFMVGFFKSSGIREKKVRQKRDARRKKKSDASSLDYRNLYTGRLIVLKYLIDIGEYGNLVFAHCGENLCCFSACEIVGIRDGS